MSDCPDNLGGHNFMPPDPPEHIDTRAWDDQGWDVWYAGQDEWFCVYCGESDG